MNADICYYSISFKPPFFNLELVINELRDPGERYARQSAVQMCLGVCGALGENIVFTIRHLSSLAVFAGHWVIMQFSPFSTLQIWAVQNGRPAEHSAQ